MRIEDPRGRGPGQGDRPDARGAAPPAARFRRTPERVYLFLFGSRVRSETGPDSDCDILLVVPDDAPPECRRARLAYQVLRGTGVAADVLVWTRRAFEERLRVLTSLPGAVVREGRVLIGDAVEVARAPGALSHAHTQSRR